MRRLFKNVKSMTSLFLAVLMIASVLQGTFLSALAAADPPRFGPDDLADWGAARWIWSSDPADLDPVSGLATETDVWMNFRRDFTLASAPTEAIVRISVESRYWMWVNGVEVVWEGQVKRGPNMSYTNEDIAAFNGTFKEAGVKDNYYETDDTYFDELDIAEYLNIGENSVAIQVWNWGRSGYSHNYSGSGGFLFSSDIPDTGNGNQPVESGDGKWWALKNPANHSDSLDTAMRLPEYNIVYDAREEIDWTDGDYDNYAADGWNIAGVIGESGGRAGDGPWNGLWQRPIPMWKDYGRKALPAEPVDGYPVDFTLQTLEDAGMSVSGPYFVNVDFKLAAGTGYGGTVNGLNILFGASGTDQADYYQARLNYVPLDTGSGAPTFTVRKGSTTHLTVDLSAAITSGNYKDEHSFTIDVVSASKIDYYLDGVLIGTSDDINAVSNQFCIGLRPDINDSLAQYGIYSVTKAEILDLLVESGAAALWDNVTCIQEMPDTVTEAGTYILPRTPVFFGANEVNGQKYQITLPYNCQCVQYVILGENTAPGLQIIMDSNTFENSSVRATYITKAGGQEYEAKNWRSGQSLFFTIPDGVEVKEFGYREVAYNVPAGERSDFEGYFDSILDPADPTVAQFTGGHTWADGDADNNFYDELWKKSARTAYVTIRDNYMDCPDRERAQYIGDAINEMEEAYYSLGAAVDALTAKCIANIVDYQAIVNGNEGRETDYYMSNDRPGTHPQELIIQSLGTAYGAARHYLFTGDEELVTHAYQRLYNYLTMHDMQTDTTHPYFGLVKVRTAQGFIGALPGSWCDWGNNIDQLMMHNVWWYASAKSVREMADYEGSGSTPAQKAWLDSRMRSIEENFYRFWDDSLQAYATPRTTSNTYGAAWLNAGAAQTLPDNSHTVDDRVNALGILFGLIPSEKYPAMRDVFMGTNTAPAYENASIYMEKYIINALYYMGYADEAMARAAKRHMEIVNNKEWTTMPEDWDSLGKSSNHGWSGGTMIALSRYAAGVEPTAPGYEQWHVVPQLGSFISIDTRVPSVIGYIDLTISRDKDTGILDMTVTSPGNNAEFWAPVEDNQAAIQTGGPKAEYLGIKEAYGKTYSVYSTSVAGTFSFAVGAHVMASIRSDEDAVAVNAPASYTVSLNNAKGAGVVTLSITADGRYLDLNNATALNGFSILDPLAWEYVGGQQWKGTVKLYYPGFVQNGGPFDILRINGTARDLFGDAMVTLTDFTVTGDMYGSSGAMPSVIMVDEAVTSVVSKAPVYSKYDLNHDGNIDELDLAIVVYYYLANDLEADWEVVKFDIAAAKDCDVAVNGRVDLADMIEVIANYCDSYVLQP